MVCFTCGLPAGETPRLNTLPGGQVCPTCRDRLLESLPPLLPSEEEEGELDAFGFDGELEEEAVMGPHLLPWEPEPDAPA